MTRILKLWRIDQSYVAIMTSYLVAKIVAVLFAVWLANFTYRQWSPVPGYIRITEIGALTRWDTVRYIEIAQYGYGYEWADYAFMPLYPALIWLATFVTEDYKLSAIIISNLFSFTMIIPLAKVLRLYLTDDEAKRATVLTLFYPVLFVFALVGYAESLLLFLVFYSWYYFKKERHLPSAIFLSLAILTKLTVIIIFATYIFMLFKRRRFRATLAFTPIILILLTASIYLYKSSGDPFILVTSHHEWNIRLQTPVQGFYRILIDQRMPTAWWVCRIILYLFFVGFAILKTLHVKDVELTTYSVGFYILTTCYARLYDFPRLTLPIISIYITLGKLIKRNDEAILVAGCFLASALYLLYNYAIMEYIG